MVEFVANLPVVQAENINGMMQLKKTKTVSIAQIILTVYLQPEPHT